ncbi:MAG TPA: tetratricopeptide repeat protein, partial [Phycisphaeraceae bacterium]|nr:tetratricopeptide repeat protein [Phycisphaeraceae bacterium]
KPASMKEKSKYNGKTPLDKYLRALFIWGKDPVSPATGLDVMRYAADLGLAEIAYRVGELTLNRVPMMKRGAQKDMYLKLMKLFAEIGGYDKAVEAGEAAIRLDPDNAKLIRTVRGFSAEATISRAGYEEAGGEEGGFRKFIRDSEKQQELLDADSLVKTEETAERALLTAEKAYKEDPLNQNNIRHYLRLLQERGTHADLTKAMQVAEKAYEDTQQFQFRRIAGEIRLNLARTKLRQIKAKAEAPDATEADRERYRRGKKALLKLELEEYDAQVKAYPTDLSLKYELGKRLFATGDYDKALAVLQAAKGDPKHRAQVMYMLGQCFRRKGWMLEAIESFREGLEAHFTQSDELGLDLRYALMEALAHEAESNNDLERAQEAFSIASSIAMEQIGYKDIGEKRTQLHELVNRLKDNAHA